MSGAAQQFLLTVVAVGLTAGILIGVADTPLYPLVYGILIVALIYVIVTHPAVISQVNNFLGSHL